MKVMVLVKATTQSEAGALPSEELLTEMGKFNEALVKAGILLAAEGLHPSSRGKRVRFSGKQRTVVDGPFAETKELVAGFWLWQVKSMEEAIEWVKRCPNPMTEDSEIEVRRVFAPEDFAEVMTPAIESQNEQMRAEVQRYSLAPPRFERLKETLIAGLNESYTFETRFNIPQQWQRLIPYLGAFPGQIGESSYGVCWNYRPGSGFDYLAGVEVSSASRLPQGFDQVTLAAGRYAVFAHQAHVSSIASSIDAIWTKWLPNSGFQVANVPSFERYTEEFDRKRGVGGIEIWVPLTD